MNFDRATICLISCLLLFSFPTHAKSQNSTRKNRVKPNTLTAKAGSLIHWNGDLENAMGISKSSGKPVFWYVPTLRGTFMDRKVEIDRYMMTGFFSWPHIIKYLNANFICVKSEPTPQQQKQLNLSRYKFIEPGFLIIANGQVIQTVDQITTQHPAWFLGLLQNSIAGHEISPVALEPSVKKMLTTPLSDHRSQMKSEPKTESTFAYSAMLTGMRYFQLGEQKSAVSAWKMLIEEYPQNPLAFKAAAEIQGIGPFTRGFETLSPIPANCMNAGINSRGSMAPAGSYTEAAIWERSTNFLISMQRKNGSFVDSDYDFGGTDSLPNVYVAVTSLAGMALIEALERQNDDFRIAKIDDAIKRCFQFVTNESNVNRKAVSYTHLTLPTKA